MLDPDYTEADMTLMCTLQVRSVKSRFFRTHKSTRYRYEKAILYPRNLSNGSKFCTLPEQAWGKQSVSKNLGMSSGPSFIAKYNCGRAEKLFANL